jgi:hypothetical protein
VLFDCQAILVVDDKPPGPKASSREAHGARVESADSADHPVGSEVCVASDDNLCTTAVQ